MVSSTFADFRQHREALIQVISGQGLHPIAMEQDSARAVTVIESSLEKVRDAAAYVGIIGPRYGTIPESDEANPERLSLTELEFREARRLGRPILLFVMGADHPVKVADVEQDPEKIAKLAAFRADAIRASAGNRVDRVYKEFNSVGEFEVAAAQAIAGMKGLLDHAPVVVAETETEGIPQPPALYAQPRYIGSHSFVGRAAQLQMLTDWAAPADPHPVLLFEAIGGTGKSMLTWEWTTRHATSARADWAGVYWYSFYEKGAVMTDFCAHALAYMTGQPLDVLQKKRQWELTDLLLRQLQARPWLLVLDGLERVLVAYHRHDAAQLADEVAGLFDKIARRDPYAAVRPRDEDLLRQLAGAAPSKILITSRLVPRVLLNPSRQPIPGVLQQRLPGLRAADAEALFRACGVRGDSGAIQDYLQRHCDCHPLVTGILAGLINNYLPDRGNFDAWASDPGYGARLNLAELDLVVKRNNILTAAIEALPAPARQLLSTLALLPEAADYETVEALNPHRPPKPGDPALGGYDVWYTPSEEVRQNYERAHAEWLASPEVAGAAEKLAATVEELERRGLLQYDRQTRCYDLHPVVRGVASGGLPTGERDRLGERVVDYFATRTHNPYEEARTVQDLQDGLTVVKTLLQLSRPSQGFQTYRSELRDALRRNVEAPAEVVALLRPCFTAGWTRPVAGLSDDDFTFMVSDVGDAFHALGENDRAIELHTIALRWDVSLREWGYVAFDLYRLAEIYRASNQLHRSERCLFMGLRLLDVNPEVIDAYLIPQARFTALVTRGSWQEASDRWPEIKAGPAEDRTKVWVDYVDLLHCQGKLTEAQLVAAEEMAETRRDRLAGRRLLALRGVWQLGRGEHQAAASSFEEAIRLAHESGIRDPASEAWLALARVRSGSPPGTHEIVRLSASSNRSDLALGELWLAVGNRERAVTHALDAYTYAWADGEPYVRRYDLTRAADLLRRLDVKVPVLRPFDPDAHPPLPWETEVEEALGRLRTERSSEDDEGLE